MTKPPSDMALKELRRLTALGNMPWYPTAFTFLGRYTGISHLLPGSHGWIPPTDALHPDVRDVGDFQLLGQLQDIEPSELSSYNRKLDVTIRISPWGERHPKIGLLQWRDSRWATAWLLTRSVIKSDACRSNRFRLTVTARHKHEASFLSREKSFWRFLHEQGGSLADKHCGDHPALEAHDIIIGE